MVEKLLLKLLSNPSPHTHPCVHGPGVSLLRNVILTWEIKEGKGGKKGEIKGEKGK